MARAKCPMRDFINFNRVYKAHRTIVWWTTKVFRLHWIIGHWPKCNQLKKCNSILHETKKDSGPPSPPTMNAIYLWIYMPRWVDVFFLSNEKPSTHFYVQFYANNNGLDRMGWSHEAYIHLRQYQWLSDIQEGNLPHQNIFFFVCVCVNVLGKSDPFLLRYNQL